MQQNTKNKKYIACKTIQLTSVYQILLTDIWVASNL